MSEKNEVADVQVSVALLCQSGSSGRNEVSEKDEVAEIQVSVALWQPRNRSRQKGEGFVDGDAGKSVS